MELLLGKKFKLEALEACIRTMALGEVASFTIDKVVSFTADLTDYMLLNEVMSFKIDSINPLQLS